MKVLQTAETHDGIVLERVDWADRYPTVYAQGETINAYPIARESGDGYFSPKRGERFLLELNCGSEQNARLVFERLKRGEIALKDCAEYASNKTYLRLI